MSDSISLTRMVETDQYLIRIVLDTINRGTLAEIADAVPRLVAERYAKDHAQEIMDKVSASEVCTLIASAVAQIVADAYKPAGPQTDA